MPDAVPGSGATAANETDKVPALLELERDGNKQTDKQMNKILAECERFHKENKTGNVLRS